VAIHHPIGELRIAAVAAPEAQPDQRHVTATAIDQHLELKAAG
jgi:hypothetical protein